MPDMLRCTKCGVDKPDDEFHAQPRNPGRRGLDSYCKECKNVRWADRSDLARGNKMAAAKVKSDAYTAWLAGIKLAAGCTDCGYARHAHALHFDHLPGHEKLFNVGSATARDRSIVIAEIAKCEVVCANCHAIRTAERRLAS